MNCTGWEEPVVVQDPKIMTEIDGENWIIKFPAHVDKKMWEKWNTIILCVQKPVEL